MKIKFKPIIAVLAFGLAINFSSRAQEEAATVEEAAASSGGGIGIELTYGVEAGTTWSSFSRGGSSFTDNMVGFAVGGFAKTQLMGPLGVSAELLYSQQGGANVAPEYYFTEEQIQFGEYILEDVDVRLHKLSMPILLNVTPDDMPGAGDVKPVAYAGVDLGYVIAANSQSYYRYSDFVIGNVPGSEVISSFYRFDYAAVLGTGVTFEGENRGYGIDVKYRFGLNNINYNVLNYISNFYNQNSLMVSLKVGL